MANTIKTGAILIAEGAILPIITSNQIKGEPMEPNIQNQPQPFKPNVAPPTARAGSDGDQTVAGKASNAVHAVREQVKDRGAEMIDQVKKKASEVYDQANKGLSEQYEKSIDYDRENPGKTALIAFGVGVGLLMMSNFGASRRRVIEPVTNGGVIIDDATMQEVATKRLADQPDLASVSAVIREGRAILAGSVNSAAIKVKAEHLVKAVLGVKSVDNQIVFPTQ